MKHRREKPNVYLVTVERDRVIREKRTVQVIAYTPDAAKMLAKQKRPKDGWEQWTAHASQNSAATTTFGPSFVEYVGIADVPNDPLERHKLLNDSAFVVKVQGEFEQGSVNA